MSLRVRFLHMLQQIIDGREVGEGCVITMVLSLGSCRVGQPASAPPRWALSTTPADSSLAAMSEGAGPILLL